MKRLIGISIIAALLFSTLSVFVAPLANHVERATSPNAALTLAAGQGASAANLGTRYVNCPWGGWCHADFSMQVSNRVWVVASHEYCPPGQGCSYWAEGRWTPGYGPCNQSTCYTNEWFQAVAWYDHIYAFSASDLNGNAYFTYAGP